MRVSKGTFFNQDIPYFQAWQDFIFYGFPQNGDIDFVDKGLEHKDGRVRD